MITNMLDDVLVGTNIILNCDTQNTQKLKCATFTKLINRNKVVENTVFTAARNEILSNMI